jgi:hypothetical protein
MKIKFYPKSGTLHVIPGRKHENYFPTALASAISAELNGTAFTASAARVQVGHYLFHITGEDCATLYTGKRVILLGKQNAVRDVRDAMRFTDVPRRNRSEEVQRPKVKRPAPKCFIPAEKTPSMREYKIGKKGRIYFRSDWHIITFSRDKRRHEWKVTPEQFNKAEYDVKAGRVDNLGVFCQQFMLAGMKEVK